MCAGAQRSVIVTPEQGYGDKGYDEIPAGAKFELQIEILSLSKA
jgi:peptidylprolyl isomerase